MSILIESMIMIQLEAIKLALDTGQRLDIFVGGAFFKKHNFAFRVGYNELQPAADSATSVEKKKVSVTDYSIGATIDGVDFWGKYADEPKSDNGTFKSNSHGYSFQVGARKNCQVLCSFLSTTMVWKITYLDLL